MKSSKTSIRKKIFFSHISIITISSILIFIAFNLCLNFYINKKTRRVLIESAQFIEKSIRQHSKSLKEESENYETANLLTTNKNLREIQSFLDINYIIVDKNEKLLYPKENEIENFNIIKKTIISTANEKNMFKTEKNRSSYFYFYILRKKYYAQIYPLKSLNSSSYLIVYSDLVRSNGFIKIVNIILVIILVITGIIAMLISNNVSKKISYPISQLIDYTRKIGNREYDAESIKYTDKDEIGQLADTMHLMSEELLKYDNTMKTFVQNASHDLRTPLMSIQGYAEAIKYKVTDEEDKAVDIIIEESKRLSALVDDLLYLSRIETMQENFDFKELNLENVINNSIDKVRGIALKDKKTIKNLSSNNICIKGDEEKLIRAMINILGNCLRYCEKNIDIISKKENSKVSIIIEDDGCGFDEKDIGNIFNRFYKGKSGSYGLGLTIAKSIIERHGGSIIAQNSNKGGAQFIITL